MSGGITHIIHPEPYQGYPYNPEEVNQWKEEHNQEKLEKILLDRNNAHFQQAKGTPFTTAEMLEALRFTTGSTLAEDVLQGKDVEGPTLEATQILRECRRVLPPDEKEIMTEEMKMGFKRWDKKTSTSPSGMHLGMYKYLTENSEQEQEKTYLLETITGIVNIALKRGITLKRWCRVNNVLIEKDSNNPTLHRLRIIHIIEADYNLATKILWARRMMPKAEKSKLLTDSSWGLRRIRSAQDTCTVK